MPSIDALKRKWFLNFKSPAKTFPPVARHEGSRVSDHTDGSLVAPLVDGQAYMRVWHDSIRAMLGRRDCEVYHTAWRIEGVRALGHSVPASDALETLNDAQNKGVKVYLMASRHAGGLNFNSISIAWLRTHGIWTAALDNRFPPAGSNHQKAVNFKDPRGDKAILGSLDISKTRWDRTAHSHTDPERNPTFGKPTHDVGVQVEGPVVADIELSFRERWNDSSRTLGLDPLLPPLPKITTPLSAPRSMGPHSVQVLHTYGRTSTTFGYSWSPVGEFTVWASCLNAIRTARTLIYIEDQYFLPFDWPPCHTRTGTARDSDVIFQLGEAIKRGVRVAVLVPSNAEDRLHVYQKYQRDIGVRYLAGIAASRRGEFTIASLHNGTSPVYVHAKLMFCDDEFALVGTANVGQRSMTHDGELHIGVVDATNTFTRDFRTLLWAEHLGRPRASLEDPIAAYASWKSDVTRRRGRVRPYPLDPPGSPPTGHGRVIRTLVDPYAGPPR